MAKPISTCMKISLTPNVLRGYFSKPEAETYKNDIRTLLWRVRQCGYDGIELGTPAGFSHQEYKTLLDEIGLMPVTVTGLGYPALKGGDFTDLLKECGILGIKNVMVSHVPNVVLGNPDELARFISNLNRVGKILMENGGVHLSYHNHAIDFSKIGGVTILEKIAAKTDERYVFFEPDTHWLQAGGGHVVSWLKKLKGRMYAVRFMDYAIDSYSDHTFLECTHKLFAEIGMGNLNWPGIIKECESQGIKWCAVGQEAVCRPPYEAIALSCHNLREYLREVPAWT